MDTIRVNTELLDSCAALIGQCGTDASSLAQEISQVLSSLPESCTEKYSRVIQSYQKEMQSISNDLGYLKTGVSKASQLFEQCEQTVQQGVPEEAGEGAFASGGSVGKIDWTAWPFTWIDAVLDFFGIDPYGRDSTAEQDNNDLMHSQVDSLFDNAYYGEKNWSRATASERKAILNSLKDELNAIYGTNVTADIDYYYGPSNEYGYYNEVDNMVHINVNSFNTHSREDVMNTVVHEMRHAYQYEVIQNPDQYIVSNDTVKTWENNWYNYISYKPELNNYDAYYGQPIEADAFGFADSVNYNGNK